MSTQTHGDREQETRKNAEVKITLLRNPTFSSNFAPIVFEVVCYGI